MGTKKEKQREEVLYMNEKRFWYRHPKLLLDLHSWLMTKTCDSCRVKVATKSMQGSLGAFEDELCRECRHNFVPLKIKIEKKMMRYNK